MAKPEQTEKPTPRRRGEARGRGQIARSADIGSSAVFLTIIIALHALFFQTLDSAAQAFSVSLVHAGSHDELNIHSVWGLFARAFVPFSALLMLAFLAAVGVGVLANIFQFGFLFVPKLIAPNFGKLNPLPGFQRLFFSVQTLINLGKQVAKILVVLIIVWLSVKDNLTMFYALASASPHDMIAAIEGLVYGIGIRVGVLLLVLGILDYFWEKRKLEQSLKMTKTEVKDEHKQSEGNPEAKQAVRSRQRAAARKRMMAAVPKATVVVTNPTHFAVALLWDEIKMDAPVVVAKGADLLAKRIREVARENEVPILENPPLARTLYDKVELDSAVPPDLYTAVAQVIAFVYKLKNRSLAS